MLITLRAKRVNESLFWIRIERFSIEYRKQFTFCFGFALLRSVIG